MSANKKNKICKILIKIFYNAVSSVRDSSFLYYFNVIIYFTLLSLLVQFL